MMSDSRLYATHQQHKNDRDYQTQNRRFFHSNRSYKYLIVLVLLAVHTFFNLDEESSEFKRILKGEGEVNFKQRTKHTSQISITIEGVEPRFPDPVETMHFESTLFYLLNDVLKTDNIQIRDTMIMTPLNEIITGHVKSSVEHDDEEQSDDDDDGEKTDDDDDEEGRNFVQNEISGQDPSNWGFMVETAGKDEPNSSFVTESLRMKDAEPKPADELQSEGSQLYRAQVNEVPNIINLDSQQPRHSDSGVSVASPEQDNTFAAESSITNDKTNEISPKEARFSNYDASMGWGHLRKRRDIETDTNLVHTLKVEVKVTSRQYVTEESERIEDILLTAVGVHSDALMGALINGDELSDNEKEALFYYRNLRNIRCTSVKDARTGIEDHRLATTLPPRVPTSAPTAGRMYAASNPEPVDERLMAPPIETQIDTNTDPIGNSNSGSVLEKQPKAATSKANEYRSISACIFVVTLIAIGFWNMVRLNRMQVERRRRKVELAKVAYSAPLSMTNGVMDVGSDSSRRVPSVATVHNYGISALNENRYAGTMDKNTDPPI